MSPVSEALRFCEMWTSRPEVRYLLPLEHSPHTAGSTAVGRRDFVETKEKSMRSFINGIVILCFIASATAQAALVESGCVTVTAVVNDQAQSAVLLALSPAIPGCTPNTTPGIEFAVGVNGVTAGSLNSYLASGLSALATGQRVMVIYDDSTSNCYGLVIATGGFHGEC
jgi:hypothetical protein